MTITTTHVGQGDPEPGHMATLIMQLPFKVAMENERYKSNAIEDMHHRTALREPMRRSSRSWASARLTHNISQKLCNVESAMVQIVGTEPRGKCTSCRSDHGPWAKCLEVRGIDSLTACGNCRYGGNETRCDFNRPPASEPQAQAQSANRRRRPAEAQRQRTAYAETLGEILADMDPTIEILREEMREIQGKFRDLHGPIHARHSRQYGPNRTINVLRRTLPHPLDDSQTADRLSNIYEPTDQVGA